MSRRVNELIIIAALCLAASSVAGCACAPRNRGTYVPATTGEPPAGQMRVVLWFGAPSGEPVPVTRTLPVARARVWTAIDALVAGPRPDAGLVATLPPGSKLHKVTLWDGGPLPPGTVDLDFDASLGQPDRARLDAIGRTLAQFAEVSTARVLIEGVPATGPGASAGALLLRPAGTVSLLQYRPTTTGTRTYLSARQITGVSVASDFSVVAERLLTTEYLRSLLPRGAKVTWSNPQTDGDESVTVTITLRKSKLSDRDWEDLQIAADALALSLRSVPGAAAISVRVAGQERSFAYIGAIWPNPE